MNSLDNEWLENEMRAIDQESRVTKDTSNYRFMFLALALLSVFFCSPCDAALPRTHNICKRVEGGGQTFYCHTCQTRQWHDDKNADWAGRFYCRSCGKQLN